jgi:hypothetical protein
MRNLLGALGGILLSVLLAVAWLPWAVWFAPLAGFAGYFAIRKPRWSALRFFYCVCLAGVGTGIWSLILLNVLGPNLPRVVQELLTLHLEPDSQPIVMGRYMIGGMDGGEFLGYIALVSIGGGVAATVMFAMQIAANISESRSKRVWCFRCMVLLIVAGGTFMVYQIAKPFAVLFGFIAYMLSVGFLLDKTDPRDELATWKE